MTRECKARKGRRLGAPQGDASAEVSGCVLHSGLSREPPRQRHAPPLAVDQGAPCTPANIWGAALWVRTKKTRVVSTHWPQRTQQTQRPSEQHPPERRAAQKHSPKSKIRYPSSEVQASASSQVNHLTEQGAKGHSPKLLASCLAHWPCFSNHGHSGLGLPGEILPVRLLVYIPSTIQLIPSKQAKVAIVTHNTAEQTNNLGTRSGLRVESLSRRFSIPCHV